MIRTVKKLMGILTAIAVIAFGASPLARRIENLPDEIYLDEAGSIVELATPLSADITGSRGGTVEVMTLEGETLSEAGGVPAGEKVILNAAGQSDVDAAMDVKLFGVTIKTVKISSGAQKKVVPGGHSVGVTLYTNGALIVGMSDMPDGKGNVVNPALAAGLMAGDIIESVNGVKVDDAPALTNAINNSSGSVTLGIKRNGRQMTVDVTPFRDPSDGILRLGAWVRDSMAGVGTLTFYDPSDKGFGCLGHAISDIDTRAMLDVRDGEIVMAEIVDIKVGQKGSPGEIHGSFRASQSALGSINKNSSFGVYGKAYSVISNPVYKKAVPVAPAGQVSLGPASILSTVDNEGIKEFDIEIIKITSQEQAAHKGMVIKVVDEELLRKTGGIIQGMSGSPIMQNGRLVGAVTHVFVNDPSRGYGIFIQWMLNENK
ncbi:MAG: SpoIVB peptidase [Christensenellales bacterium]